jgi:hypothetical protein
MGKNQLLTSFSRAIKRVERLKVEVAKKLEGQGKTSFPTQCTLPRRLLDRDWSVALDVVAPYDAALPHQVQLGIRRKESALHATIWPLCRPRSGDTHPSYKAHWTSC